VVLEPGSDVLEVRVTDDGTPDAADDATAPHAPTESRVDAVTGGSAGPGRGIVGMRERCQLLGGELTAGPRASGGFEVKARLPLVPAGKVHS
jgi:signal transduction histidine kinase